MTLNTEKCKKILERDDLNKDEKLLAVFNEYRGRIQGQQLCIALEKWESETFSELDKIQLEKKLTRSPSY